MKCLDCGFVNQKVAEVLKKKPTLKKTGLDKPDMKFLIQTEGVYTKRIDSILKDTKKLFSGFSPQGLTPTKNTNQNNPPKTSSFTGQNPVKDDTKDPKINMRDLLKAQLNL